MKQFFKQESSFVVINIEVECRGAVPLRAASYQPEFSLPVRLVQAPVRCLPAHSFGL
jgi:hypothetical protein